MFLIEYETKLIKKYLYLVFFICRSVHKDLLATIAKEGQISKEVDSKLKDIVTTFIAGFTG